MLFPNAAIFPSRVHPIFPPLLSSSIVAGIDSIHITSNNLNADTNAIRTAVRGIATVSRVIDARIARLARGTNEAATCLSDANSRAIGPAMGRIARIAWVIDACLARFGALLTGETAAGSECRSAAVDGGGDRGAVDEDADATAVGTAILRVAVVVGIVDAGLAFLGALDVGDAAAEGSWLETQAGTVRLGITARLGRVGEAFLPLGAGG